MVRGEEGVTILDGNMSRGHKFMSNKVVGKKYTQKHTFLLTLESYLSFQGLYLDTYSIKT